MKLNKIFSIIFALFLLIISFAVTVNATSSRTSDQCLDLTLAGTVSQDTLTKNGHIRLTENYKEYLYQAEYENADGTYTVYFFSNPVKYVTDEGEIAYIDTSLESTNMFERIKGYSYRTKANAIKVYFPSKSNGEVLMSGNEFSIKQQIESSVSSPIVGSSSDEKTIQYAKNGGLNAPIYSYAPTSTGFTGTVQFDTPDSLKKVLISLSSEGFDDCREEEGFVYLLTNGKPVASLYCGELTDAVGRYISIPTVGLMKQKGKYEVAFRIDTDSLPAIVDFPLKLTYYLNASSSAWKPSEDALENLRTSGNETNYNCPIQDTMVSEANPNTNYSNATALTIQQGTGQVCRIYTKFDLSSLSAIRYDQILSARYTIYQYYNYLAPTRENCDIHSIYPNRFDVELHQVKTAYTPSTVTWNTKPDHYAQRLIGESIVPEMVSGTNAQGNPTQTLNPLTHHHFMLTSLVQGWLQGLNNNGIVLLMRDESLAVLLGRRFPSSVFSSGTIGPLFTVTYTSDTSSSDNIGIENNAVYYIKCKGSVTENSTSSVPLYLTAPTAAHGIVRLQAFTGGNTQKWKVVSAGNGYYYIKPMNNTNYTMYATGGAYYEVAAGQLTDPEDEPYKRWKFVRNWDGSYHIIPQYSNGNIGLWIEQTAANRMAYTAGLAVNMNHKDDWTLEKVSKGNANVFCFDDNAKPGYGLNTRAYVETMYDPNTGQYTEPYTSSGFYGLRISSSGYNLHVRCNESAAAGKTALTSSSSSLSSDLWIFSGHGGGSGLWFVTPTTSSCLLVSDNQWGGWENKSALDDVGHGALSHLRYVMLHACDAGMDDIVENDQTYNLVGAMYHKGAHFLQGYTITTSTFVGDWLQYFWESAENGETIEDAMQYADDMIWQAGFPNSAPNLYNDISSTIYNRHILGDTAMCLNPQPVL